MPETISFAGLELRFLLTKDETGGSLDMFEMTVQPGTRMPVPHYHESWDETVYGLTGATTMRVDGHDILLGAGQTVFIRRGIVHSFRNDSDAPSTCLCVLSPGVLGPGYFREMQAMLGNGAPDPAKMKQVMLRYGLVPAPGRVAAVRFAWTLPAENADGHACESARPPAGVAADRRLTPCGAVAYSRSRYSTVTLPAEYCDGPSDSADAAPPLRSA